MYDLNRMSTPVLQDWWEHYVCPTCMSKDREGYGLCADRWHAVPAVAYECPGSAFSPISIPVTELEKAGSAGDSSVAKYGRIWTRLTAMARRRGTLEYV
jgi:hypothetical protein